VFGDSVIAAAPRDRPLRDAPLSRAKALRIFCASTSIYSLIICTTDHLS
jgi:hypothetical protein